jgi:hypothetical protein
VGAGKPNLHSTFPRLTVFGAFEALESVYELFVHRRRHHSFIGQPQRGTRTTELKSWCVATGDVGEIALFGRVVDASFIGFTSSDRALVNIVIDANKPAMRLQGQRGKSLQGYKVFDTVCSSINSSSVYRATVCGTDFHC